MKQSSARFDIEAMRAFAVGVVLLFHAGIAPFNSGFIGVDVFFVISGYLIIGALYREYIAEGRILILEFWGRRARRLLPATTLVIGVTALASFLLVGRLTQADVRYDMIAAAAYVANIRFAMVGNDYWAPEYVSPVLHFWSLGVEEQFYIIVPLVILIGHVLFWRVPMRHMKRAFLGLLAVAGAASLAYCLNLAAENATIAYYHTGARAWEFALGGLAAVGAREITLAGRWRLATISSLWLLLLGSSIYIDVTAGYPGWTTVIPVAAATGLLWLGFESPTVDLVRLSEGWKSRLQLAIAWLGSVSYSVYLWHWPVFWVLATLFGDQSGQPHNLDLGLAAIGTAITLGLAQLTKMYVEDPFRFRKDLVRSGYRSVRLGINSSFTAVSLVAITAVLPAASLIDGPAEPDPTSTAVWQDEAPDWLDELIAEYAPPATGVGSIETALPALADARNDFPRVALNGCHAEIDEVEPTRRCSYGDRTSERTIAIFGDSHVEQYFGGIEYAAKRNNLKFLPRTRSACPSVDVSVWLKAEGRAYPECDTWRESVMTELLEVKPDYVILSNLILFSVFDRDTGKVALLPSRAREIWMEGYTRTINRLTAAGIKVLVVRDVPRWGFDVPDCLATYGPEECVGYPTAAMTSSRYDIGLTAGMTNAIGLDLTMAICEPTICRPIRDNKIIARDEVHLTKTYGDALGPLWQAIFLKLDEAWPA